MSELFDEEEKELIEENELLESDALLIDSRPKTASDARRRLEDLLDQKRLKDELEDFEDY